MSFSDAETTVVTVRQANSRDLEVIGDLWVELMSYHARLDTRFSVPVNGRASYMRHIHAAIRDTNFCVLVATVNKRDVVGFVMGYIGQNPPIFPIPQFGFIADLSVSYQYRRHGIGQKLVAGICRWFREHGMRNVQMNVAHRNTVSQAFWRKMGCSDYIDHMWLDIGE